jgi:hypothetical protein
MNDLFGQEIRETTLPKPPLSKKRRNETPAGYAAQPGTGPAGHFCKDCRHICRKNMSKTYLKCGLMRIHWTGGFKTDIRANSPACRHWASKVQIDPSGKKL